MDASNAAHQVLLFPPPFLFLYSSCSLPLISVPPSLFLSHLSPAIIADWLLFLVCVMSFSLACSYTCLCHSQLFCHFLGFPLCVLFMPSFLLFLTCVSVVPFLTHFFLFLSSVSRSPSQTYMCMYTVVCTHVLA